MILARSESVFTRNQITPLAAIALTFGIHATAAASLIGSSFSLKISEKEAVLSNPGDHAMEKFLMWDVSSQRIADRNMPFVEVANDANSDAPITELRMTIGDTRFNFSDDFFGSFTVLGDSSPFTNISSTTASGGDELVVMFGGGGLQPGQLVRFRIDLGVDAGFGQFFSHPDFRTVLFDMNGRNIYDGNVIAFSDADNSEATARFDDGKETAFASTRLPDYQVSGSQSEFYNNVFRTYGIMEGIDTFPSGGTVVPEPNGLALASIGLVGVGLVVGRRSSPGRRQYARRGANHRSRFSPRPARQNAYRRSDRQALVR